jgi:hypothetical protein
MNMKAQPFYEDWLSALRDDVQALGGNKVVGHTFWPEMAADEAGRKLATKLNGARPERLSADRERFIMKRAREVRGFSAALFYLCDDLGFERPKALNPEDKKERLQRELVAAVSSLARITEALGIDHKLPSDLRVVK